jgi:fibrillarin-like rRNA methylase
MKQGGTAGIPSLTKVYFVKDFFIAMNKLLEPCHEERSLEMIRPTLEEAMQYQKDYKVVPVLKEIYSDIRTPMQVLKILKKASKHCYMLEKLGTLYIPWLQAKALCDMYERKAESHRCERNGYPRGAGTASGSLYQ